MSVAALPATPGHRRSHGVPRSLPMQALLLLLVALATRGALFGSPLIHSDEGFYLLVGDRMVQGAWPFVDIFDRKPVGLFLIFAAIRAVGGDGILLYQLAGLLHGKGRHVALQLLKLIYQLLRQQVGAVAEGLGQLDKRGA